MSPSESNASKLEKLVKGAQHGDPIAGANLLDEVNALTKKHNGKLPVEVDQQLKRDMGKNVTIVRDAHGNLKELIFNPDSKDKLARKVDLNLDKQTENGRKSDALYELAKEEADKLNNIDDAVKDLVNSSQLSKDEGAILKQITHGLTQSDFSMVAKIFQEHSNDRKLWSKFDAVWPHTDTHLAGFEIKNVGEGDDGPLSLEYAGDYTRTPRVIHINSKGEISLGAPVR